MGLPVHLARDYVGWLVQQVQQRNGCHVVTLNAEMSMQAEQSDRLANIIRNAELIIPDGAGIVLYLRLYGKRVQRLPGIELAEGLLRRLGEQPETGSVFFYGGKPEVIQQAAQFWQTAAPNLVVHTQHGYLSPEEQPALAERLQTLQPAVILVGLGVPRQEHWIADHRPLCPNAVWIGVGGSFDIWSGSKTRAPEFFCQNNLEWLYRLYQEPWRWRRMTALPKFALRALRYRLFHHHQ
jgi:N-acetylglucosaminyldiphosphoundecaprenol N-acetyl-beta-D-mannosaminyltransferase